MSIFSLVKGNRVKRSVFDLSHDVKMSMKMGILTPILCQEILPGDKFSVTTESMVRMAPMLAPIMHRLNIYTHYFFVPNRILWDNWEDFITGGKNGDLAPSFPRIDFSGVADVAGKGSLVDYFGIAPVTQAQSISPKVSALPFRAYQMIYNEFFRDQNLTEPVDIRTDLGGVIQNNDYLRTILSLRKRSWEKDYFTSALPWTQRGGEVIMPVGGNVVVDYSSGNAGRFTNNAGEIGGDPEQNAVLRQNAGEMHLEQEGYAEPLVYDPNGTLKLENGQTTINDLRRASRLQEWLERNARGGARYFEQLIAHFGVPSPDARLQRPEFLGGGKSPLLVSEVLQTSSTDASSPQGNMSGHGISVGKTHGFSKRFVEHGYVIGVMSVLPRTAYMQGIPRHFSRFDKFDYAFPEFANLGEQDIYQQELYVDWPNADTVNKKTFGYTPRYAEYKYASSRVAGDFRDNLAFWHMARDFAVSPNLNQDFVESNPTDRIFAVNDGTDHLWVLLHNRVRAGRPLPYFGTPRL